LRQNGYTYREILNFARRDREAGLLQETDAPVLEIALSLGYEDHANFTRAFIRWTGRTPTEFRRAVRGQTN
jgi:AraC-like DNA-binding protein